MTLGFDRALASDPLLDCAIIGGGPAGLTAALYLARFRRNVVVLDAGESRASWIPVSRNQVAFPGGVSGSMLLDRMRQQAGDHGVKIISAEVGEVRMSTAGFDIAFGDKTAAAKTVLLATGVINHQPDMDQVVHRRALAHGLIRYCPICDGFEVVDQTIAILGADGHGVSEALFIRNYSADITLIPARRTEFDAVDRRKLVEAGIKIVDAPATSFSIVGSKLAIEIGDAQRPLEFDALYPALGSTANSGLVRAMGAGISSLGCLLTDQHQMTTLDGVYAAGDVVEGLDQIAVASGQAAIAATAMHNRLTELENAN